MKQLSWMLRSLLVASAFPMSADCQWLTIGVTGGVPISPHSATYPPVTLRLNASAAGANFVEFQAPNDFYQKPYAAGPAVEIALPWKVSLAAGMLYERFHRDASNGMEIRPPFHLPSVSSVAAGAFLFPLLARYNFGRRRVPLFLEAGMTLRHLGSFSGQGLQLDLAGHPTPISFRYDSEKSVDVAVTAGGGFRYRLAVFDLVPEIRYLHWTALYQQPVQDQAVLLLTIAVPGRRR